MYQMTSQKTWMFAGQKLTAYKILKTAKVEQMAAGNWEIVANIPHMDSTIIIPTDTGDIVIDLWSGRQKVLLETSPNAYRKLQELKAELDEKYNEEMEKCYQ
jgi:hypothetical protein